MRAEFGMLCAVLANSNPWGDGKAKQPSDFYPDDHAESQQQTPEDHALILSKLFKRPPKK